MLLFTSCLGDAPCLIDKIRLGLVTCGSECELVVSMFILLIYDKYNGGVTYMDRTGMLIAYVLDRSSVDGTERFPKTGVIHIVKH